MGRKSYVYKITNIVNNKLYIGKTSSKNPYYRFSRHKTDAFSSNEKRRNTCPKLYNAMRSYGIDNFIFELIVEYETEQEALNGEEFFIEKYNTVENGMNVLTGGQFQIVGENNPMFGQGHKIAGEKNGMYGRSGELNPFFGKEHSKELKIQLSQKFSEFTDEQIADIKMMIFNKITSSEIKLKYPTISDKQLSLIRSGKRWKRILPDLNLTSRANLKLEEAQKIYDDWKNSECKTMTEFYRSRNFEKSYNAIADILTGVSWKVIKR